MASADANALFAIYGNEENARFEFGAAWTMEQVDDLIYSQSDIFLGDPGVPFFLVAIENESGSLIGAVELTINSYTYAMLEDEWNARNASEHKRPI